MTTIAPSSLGTIHIEASGQLRPRRSVLYMPGSNARAMQKARTLAADSVIFDLEDAVAPASKADARDLVAAAVAEGGYGHREVLIRVNAADTPWHEQDMAMVAASSADAAVLPKVESALAVANAASQLRASNGARPLWAMIETPLGVLASVEIAGAGNNLACLLMGTSDLAKDLRLPEPAIAGVTWSLGQAVVAARAYGLDVIDGVHLDLSDEAGFRSACQRGRAFGFDGKSLIHPSQIAMANDVFAPDEAAVERSHRVIEAYTQAEAAGSGVVLLDGKLVESLHVELAQRVLSVAAAIAQRE
jgi:citrate lyase subunit beta/citryl-CoA lyase